MIGTRAISGSPAISFRKRSIAAAAVEHRLVHVDVDDLRAVLDLLAGHRERFLEAPSRIIFAKARLPVTLVRSPMLTNSEPSPMVTGSRPDRRIGAMAVGGEGVGLRSVMAGFSDGRAPLQAAAGGPDAAAHDATPTVRMSITSSCRMRLTIGTCVAGRLPTWSTATPAAPPSSALRASGLTMAGGDGHHVGGAALAVMARSATSSSSAGGRCC
jgi:hypothetical protein